MYPHRATASTAVRESPAINIQEGAPYPADMDHLDQILSIGSGHALPEGAEVISVKPSTNFAARYPGGWGYVIAFTATDSAIRDYVTTYTDFRGENVEKYGGVKSEKGGRLARRIGGHRLHRYHRPLYYWFRRYGPSSGAPAGSGLAHYPRRTPLIAGNDRGSEPQWPASPVARASPSSSSPATRPDSKRRGSASTPTISR